MMFTAASKFLAFFCFGITFFSCTNLPCLYAQSSHEYQRRISATLNDAINFHRQSESIPDGEADRIAKKKQFYVSMARNLTPAKEASHLQFPNSTDEKWVATAKSVAKGLKVNTNYQVSKANEDSVICVDEEIARNLYSHVRFIAWYRHQLTQLTSKSSDRGAVALGNLIDAYIQTIEDGIPRVRVKMTGTLNVPRQQLIEISNNDIWGILSTINRYFFYKSQLDQSTKKHQADFLLVEAMTKTAAIYGVPPNDNSLVKIKSELIPESKGWQGEAYKALDSCKHDLESSEPTTSTIEIPAKPSAKPKPNGKPTQKKKEGFPDDVVDIREIGGKIFIKKRNGIWTIWNDK